MRWRRRMGRTASALGALTLAAALAVGCSDADPPASAPTTAATLDADARDLIARLVVAEPDPSRPDYDRDQWEEGLDADGDCLRTRHEVLAATSLVEPTIDECHVTGGSWRDPLTGRTVDDPEQLQVDHLVALADAHRSGGWRWDADRKAAFANDLDTDELNPVDGDENQRKADAGPESYRPSDPAASCWYATAYAEVKATWELTITPAQRDGLLELLATCAP